MEFLKIFLISRQEQICHFKIARCLLFAGSSNVAVTTELYYISGDRALD